MQSHWGLRVREEFGLCPQKQDKGSKLEDVSCPPCQAHFQGHLL